MRPNRYYSGLGDPERWNLPEALAEQGHRWPDVIWLTTTDGETLTFGEAARDARQMAGYFSSLGIRPGDMVPIMLPNGLDFIRVWLGLGTLGAVAVLLNTELRGAFLEHQLRNCGGELVVVDASILPNVEAVAQCVQTIQRVVVDTDACGISERLTRLPFAAWRRAPLFEGPLPSSRDIASVIYTSGTSGPSKGVLMPHAHCALFGIGAIESLALRATDRYYTVLPLFHANGLYMQIGATLLSGVSVVLRPRFSATAWLSDIRDYGITVTNILGVMASYILAQPGTPEDRKHALRVLLSAPNIPSQEVEFRKRFAIADVMSCYGMTEVNIPIYSKLGEPCNGAVGHVLSNYFEIMVADPETDKPVPSGEIGEIMVRPSTPSGFMAGYHAMPEKTVEAWRNLWFHTGDAGTMGADGIVTFIDRIKDCIRRRGENISAAEVDAAVGTLAGVAEVAACAVPSPLTGGEDEILLSIVLSPGTNLTPAEIVAHADAVLPNFARPRYVSFVAELPKTATGKIQRATLRRNGTVGAWDREVAR